MTALNRGGDRGGALIRVAHVAFQESRPATALPQWSKPETVPIGTFFSGFSFCLLRFRLVSPCPVSVSHVSDVGVVAPCMTGLISRKSSFEMIPSLAYASSNIHTVTLAAHSRLSLKSYRGERGIPEPPFLHAIAACQPGSKNHAHGPACKR